MANKISVILDVATDKAVSGLKGFKQSINDADGAVGKMKAGATSAFDSIKANAGLASIAVVGAVGAMASKSIKAASDLGESINAVNVTFGQSAAGIKALGEEAAESVGLSNSAFNGLAVQFSSFASTVAGEGGDVVGTVDEMTTRMADFASVMNIDVAEAARIFQSGLAGETEPLRKFGIDLSAAAVNAHAYATGIAEVGDTLTESEKVQSRYSLLMEETEKTAGDFANTSDGLANSQRILSAKMEDTAAKAGKQLAPAVAAVTSALSDMIPIAGTAAVKVGELFTGMTELAYDLGAAAASVAEKIPGITLSGEGMAVDDTLHDLEAMAAGAEGLIEKYAEAGMTVGEFSDKLQANGVEFTANNMATVAYAETLEETTVATVDLTEKLGDQIKVGDIAAAKTDVRAAALEAEKEAADEAKEAADDYNRVLQAQRDATDDLVEAKTLLVGGDIAVRDAQRQAAEAVGALTTLTDEGKTGTEEFAVAQDAAAEAMLAAADAAADQQIAVAEANGAVVSAKDANQIFKEKLIELASTLAPGSPLLAQILGYIDALNHIPRDIDTRIRATGGGATVGLLPTIGGPRAAGGPVSAGVAYPVGEQGPELFMPSSNGTIIPNGNGHGGGAPISITVNAGMGADGREIGDIIVGKIREYERRNGNGWRG